MLKKRTNIKLWILEFLFTFVFILFFTCITYILFRNHRFESYYYLILNSLIITILLLTFAIIQINIIKRVLIKDKGSSIKSSENNVIFIDESLLIVQLSKEAERIRKENLKRKRRILF